MSQQLSELVPMGSLCTSKTINRPIIYLPLQLNSLVVSCLKDQLNETVGVKRNRERERQEKEGKRKRSTKINFIVKSKPRSLEGHTYLKHKETGKLQGRTSRKSLPLL